jgi:hypothetical protein
MKEQIKLNTCLSNAKNRNSKDHEIFKQMHRHSTAVFRYPFIYIKYYGTNNIL